MSCDVDLSWVNIKQDAYKKLSVNVNKFVLKRYMSRHSPLSWKTKV